MTEYRGMTVGALATLRGSLRQVGAEHKVYKNTLAKLAVREAGLDVLDELLVGPTSLTFTGNDTVGAAKALNGASRTNPLLVLKGGAFGASLLSADDVRALAELPSRDELLARFAGALQAPLVKTAGLLQALPRNFAYGLSALIDPKKRPDAAPRPNATFDNKEQTTHGYQRRDPRFDLRAHRPRAQGPARRLRRALRRHRRGARRRRRRRPGGWR